MKLIEKILVPTDFYGSSDRSINMAIELAKKFDSEILLLHVLTDETYLSQHRALINEEVDRRLQAIHSKIVDAGIQKVTEVIRKGNKYHAINELAEEQEVNMILMGSGEMGTKGNAHIGTTTKRVIETSSKPVWVTTAHSSETIESIICPVDLSAPSRRALGNAIHLARNFEVKLTILHVMESHNDLPDGLEIQLEETGNSVQQDNDLVNFLEEFDFHGVNWEKKIAHGKPANEILKTLESHGPATLLVMGTTGKTSFSKFLVGSVTEKVTRALPCSFITMKEEEFIVLQANAGLQDLDFHFKQGMEMLENGLPSEALNQFKRGISINNLHAPSWVGMSLAYERLHKKKEADQSRERAQEIRTRLEEQKIVAELRSRHWLTGRP